MMSIKRSLLPFKLKKDKGQALVELSIWGGLMLIVASAMVSHILYLIYKQDLMIRNFRSAMKFASDKTWTGDKVYHVMVEHRKIPSLGASFLPDYRELREQIGVVWSWNMFWSDNSDLRQSVRLVRCVVDGRDISREIPKNPNSNSFLPKEWRNNRSFLVLSVLPDEFILAKERDILEELREKNRSLYSEAKNLFDKLERTPYYRMSEEERKKFLSQLKEIIDKMRMSAENFSTTILDLYDYLANERWRGDIDSIEDLFRHVKVHDTRQEKIEFGPQKREVEISGNYTVTYSGKAPAGKFKIEWRAKNDKIVDQ